MQDLTLFVQVYLICFSALLGLCCGSFLLCAASRAAVGETALYGRSACDKCGHVLGFSDLIPVVSYLALRGRCRYCGNRIGSACLWAELLSAAVFVSVTVKLGLSWETLEFIALAAILIYVSLTDLIYMEIPDAALLAAIGVRIIYILFSGNVLPLLLSSVIGGFSVALPLLLFVLFFEKIRKVDAMGGGDIKLFFVIGLFLGWQLTLLVLFAACLLGIIGGFITLRHAADGLARPIAFGPAIAAATWLVFCWGQPLLNYYLTFL